MSWGRLDDSFYDHPKVERIPPALRLEVVGLWTFTRSWALRHRYRRLGYVPDYVVGKFAGGKAKRLAAQLVSAGLWVEAPEGDGWDVHDFRQFLDPKDDGLTASERQQARSEHARAAAKARWEKQQESSGNARGMPEHVPEHVPEQCEPECPSNAPVPSRPVPSPNGGKRTPTENSADVVAAFIDARNDAKLTIKPAERGRVSRDAKRLLDGHVASLSELVAAARDLGAGPYDDLERQVNIRRSRANTRLRTVPTGTTGGWNV